MAYTVAVLGSLAASLIAQPLSDFEHHIRRMLHSEVQFIQLITDDLVTAGGKRFRPALVLLASRALGAPHPQEQDLAVAVELLHSATLLHDDLVDDAETRRGQEAAFRKYGNAVSVLSGDFMLSRVLKLLSEMPASLTAAFAAASMNICEGEVLQFQAAALGEYSLENYFKIIEGKTAVLLELACQAPALLNHSPETVRAALAQFGREYGMAFQIQDDVLDLLSDSQKLGKPVGGDLHEGKATLPILYLLEGKHREEIQDILGRRAKEAGDVERVKQLVLSGDSLQRTRDEIVRRSDLACAALDVLPASPAREAMWDLARSATARVL